jgi:hypothetical protein
MSALILAPALAVLAVGAVLAAFTSSVPARTLVRASTRAALLELGVTVLVVMTAMALPPEQLSDGRTCPAVGSAVGAVLNTLVLAALAVGAVVVALGLASAGRGSSRAHGLGLSLLGLALPYVALAAWLVPRFCGYS